MTKFIAVFSPYLPPVPLSVSYRMSHFIEELEDAGYTLNIIAGKKAYWGKRLFLDLPSGKVGFVASLVRETLSGLELLVRILIASEPCVFLSSPPLITNFFGALGAHWTKKYYFLDVRDLYPQIYAHSGQLKRSSPFYKLFQAMETWLYKKAAVIFTSSQRIASEIQKHHPELQGRVFCVWNGYDENHFSQIGDKPNEFKIIYHGNFGPLNNVTLLRNLAQELKKRGAPIHIDAAGVGPGAALIKAANLDNLSLIPPIKNEDLGKVLGGYHLALSFRNNNPMGETDFPAKVFECIGAGIPVFVAPRCEAGDFLEEAKAGKQFSSDEVTKMADLVCSYLENSDELFEMHQTMQKLKPGMSRKSLRRALVEVLDQL